MTAASPDRRGIVTEALRKIDDLTARLQIAERADTEPVAVVGMACRLPGGADSPSEFWELLRAGGSGIIRVPTDRWDPDAFYSEDHTVPGTICSRDGGFLTSWRPDQFDAEFFGVSPREAEAMDPQQRLLMEIAWEAVENAGITAEDLRGSQTAVYAGVTTNDYYMRAVSGGLRAKDTDPYLAFGNAANFTAGRLSYFLGVHGPAVTIDTACSSSLVTIHLACQALRRRESDMALAGGVNLILSPENSVATSRWGMLAPDGRCKTFDAAADGYVRSEGAGVVVLKRLSDAERDGDRVLAIVRGSAVNQDGPSSGLTVPSGPAQQAVLRAALAASRLEPGDIDYVEAHGTGTALGDPIELDALSVVFGDRGSSAPLVLGSVKTNLGHLESAAGIASFIKVVLSMRAGFIPPHINFSELTPNASAAAAQFVIPGRGTDWPAVRRARRAGVSSFGVSGTNAHVVVEQAPAPAIAQSPVPAVSTLTVSGKTPERVAATAGVLADWLAGAGAHVGLADVAASLIRHRSRFRFVGAVCARGTAAAVAGLRALAAGEAAPGVVTVAQAVRRSGTVFVFSGQGSHWAGMGRRLLADEPVFAAAVADLEPAFVEHIGFSLREIIVEGREISGDAQVQPVVMGVQLALVELWRSHGVAPDAVIGHSMGEVTAAVVAGILSVAEGFAVIGARSRLMSHPAGRGAVALVELDDAAVTELLVDYRGVEIAGYLSPHQTVVAGPVGAVDALMAAVSATQRFARRVNMEVASHTALMDPILDQLAAELAGLAPGCGQAAFYSTVTEDPTGAGPLDASYWVANLRRPARLRQAVAAAAAAGHDTFVEISPHPLLTHAIAATLQRVDTGRPAATYPTLRRGDDETLAFHMAAAELGAPPRLRGGFTELPASPWLHTSHWLPAFSTTEQRVRDVHPLLGVHVELLSGRDHLWQADIGTDTLSWPADRAHGIAVLAFGGFAELALAAGHQLIGDAVRVVGLTVEQPLALNAQTQVSTQLSGQSDGMRVEIYARSGGAGDWSHHATARVEATGERVESQPETGPGWSQEAIGPPEPGTDHPLFRVNPMLLETAVQRLAALVPARDGATHQPIAAGAVRVLRPVGSRGECRMELVTGDAGEHLGRVILLDDTGAPAVDVSGIRFGPTDPGALPLPLENKLYTAEWVATAVGEEQGGHGEAPAGTWLVLTDPADTTGHARELAGELAVTLSSGGRHAVTAELSAAVGDTVRHTWAKAVSPPAGVVVLLGERTFDGTDPEGELRRGRDLVLALSIAARETAAANGRLWVVSRSGLSTGAHEPGHPAVGALKGLIRTWRFPGESARVLADEPDVDATLVDLDAASTPAASARTLTAELSAPTRDDVVAWRNATRYAERLTPALLPTGSGPAQVRGDGSYVVTGGLGGLGVRVVRWLIERGAGRIVLSGRRELGPDQRAVVDEFCADAEVVYVRGDLSAPGVADRLVAAAEATGRGLRGVIHAAGVLAAGPVTAVTAENLDDVWSAKVLGGLRLHAATAGRQLDWWVGFASMAALLGLPGQAGYATANAWLDALAAWQRRAGVPATAIDWGQWSEAGMGRGMTLSVLDPIGPDEGVEALEALVGGSFSQVGVARLRFDRVVAANPGFQKLGYFAELVERFAAPATAYAAGPKMTATARVVDWTKVAAADRPGELVERLRAILARELRTSTAAIDVNQPFPELGLDSMMAMTILEEAQRLMGTDLSASIFWNHPTITALAEHLLGLLPPLEVADQNSAADAGDTEVGGILDELFERVESGSTQSESGIF